MRKLRGLFTKRKIVLLVAVGALALGLTAGVVLAQGNGGRNTMRIVPSTTFSDRVAEILGLDGEVVEDAFAQAQRGQEDELYRGRLDRMVEGGRITQEEADERYSWFQSRPDTVVAEYGHGKRGGHSQFQGRSGYGHDGWHGPRGSRHGRHGGPALELVPAVPINPTEAPSQ